MITESVDIAASPDRVFSAFVHDINRWWPRTGTYRYSFAPPHTEPSAIYLESSKGGRFFERYADGSEYDIGHVVVFDPPKALSYTWRAPDWDADTLVEVTFTPTAVGTRVTVRHRDLPTDLAEGYATGLREILHGFAHHWR